MVAESTATIQAFYRTRPYGWMGAGMSHTPVTIDVLQEAGYKFVMDWCCDDQPFWMKARAGRILCVPYPLEVNDSVTLLFRQQTASDFADMIVDQFDEMIEQMRGQAVRLHDRAASDDDGPAVPSGASRQRFEARRKSSAARPRLVYAAGQDCRTLRWTSSRHRARKLNFIVMKLPEHNRYPFSIIDKRRALHWPAGKRLAVYIAISVEHFAFGAGLGEDISTLGAPQTQRNFGWRDYGQRVGLWNLIETFDALKLPLSHAVNGLALPRAPGTRWRACMHAATKLSRMAAPAPKYKTICGNTTKRT